VVVKVQRPGIEEQIRSDTDLLFYLARFLEGVIEETGIYTPTGIVSEFRQAMLVELDFENEARNIEEFAKTHSGRELVVIPRVVRTHSSRTVLTLQELVGTKLKTVLEDPRAEGIDRKALARNILDASFQQLFADGLFHGDPHPGNVIVLPGNRLGLIDFGLWAASRKPCRSRSSCWCWRSACATPTRWRGWSTRWASRTSASTSTSSAPTSMTSS